MKVLWIICLLAFMVPAQPTGADVYRYTDQHGNEIFTDNLDQVPAGQRRNARVPDGENLTPRGSAEEKATADPDPLDDGRAQSLKEEKNALEALKEKLKEEFNTLAEENARLKAEQKKAVTPDQRKAFNKQVVNFNTRFQAYKEKKAAYDTRLEQYRKTEDAVSPNADNQ